jgi:glycosyltransferase involved in cell wall biosynthesis
MTTLAGIIVIRNGDRLDYAWRESVSALLEFCDEVVIANSDSDDGTTEAIKEWASRERRIKYFNFPWTDPKGDPKWFVTWQNFAREQSTCDHVVFTDADEIIHEDSYPLIREAAERGDVLRCKRYNFWRDASHLIPNGVCCGHEVIRVAPQSMWVPSDYRDERCLDAERLAIRSEVSFFHYGFLRRRDAFFRKAKEVLRIWANSYDPRLEAADKAGGNWMTHPGVTGWENDLKVFYGKHPKLAEKWLVDRGYFIETMSPEILIEKWQHVLDEAKHIFTWTEPASLAYCAEIASRSTHLLEIGVYMGASSFVMLKAAPQLHIWAADKFMVAGTEHVCRNLTLKQFIDEGRCELIIGDSETAANMLPHMMGKLDGVFSDNGHAEEDLRRDLRCCLPLVKSGGTFWGHDWDGDNDVARGVKSMIPEKDIRIVVPRVWSYAKP